MSGERRPEGPGHRALAREGRRLDRRQIAHQLIDAVPDDGELDALVEWLAANHGLKSGGDA
jgi:hypothetical protein